MSEIKNQLLSFEKELRQNLQILQQNQATSTQINKELLANNQMILKIFTKLIAHSILPLAFILQFLTDQDICNVAVSCRAFYILIYSPLGFRLCRYLRPIVILKKQVMEQEIPLFSKATVDQLCSDRNLQEADEDDKWAILLTMKTNILATKQKVRQLDLIIQQYEDKADQLLNRIIHIGNQREDQRIRVNNLHEEIQKLKQLLKVSDGHAESLKDQQEKMQMQRQTKMIMLTEQKAKLTRQKELLIKKIKSQQKQKQQGMIYAKQVNRVLSRLSQITTGALSHKKQ